MKTRIYKVELVGTSPLLMHKDNISGCEELKSWQKDPGNKKISTAGDDRTPSWTWLNYLYHDGERLVIDADNLMSMLRDAGKKCPAAQGKGSLKAQTQSGILVNELGWPLKINGKEIPMEPLAALKEYETDFPRHEETAKKYGVELFVKRARVGTSKHVRVRPKLMPWAAAGTITVFDDSLTTQVLQRLFDTAGFYVGLCDWRPGSPSSPGQFGRFEAKIAES
jgi:hypothetical protein